MRIAAINFIRYNVSSFLNENAVTIFCKATSIVVALKTIFSWPAILKVIACSLAGNPSMLLVRTLLAPATLLVNYPTLFLIVLLVVVVISLFLPRNYFSALLIFWIALNLIKVTFLSINGSDLVLLLLLFFTIPLSVFPRFKNSTLAFAQVSIHNFSILACRLQIGFIYLLSGWDKLQSELWRSGEAINAVLNINYLINPKLTGYTMEWPWTQLLSWFVIVFELGFPLLVWIPKLKSAILIIGVFFHLLISICLSLPDFGLIMILSYLIFIDDESYAWAQSKFKLLFR